MANDNRQTGYDFYENDLMAVCMELKSNIFRTLKVGTLGKVISVNDIIKCKPFPLLENETEKIIDCFKIKEVDVKPNDVALILFVDRNFIQNLKQIKGNQKLTSLQQNIDLHSDKFGIIIGTL